jgi:hypothetical protein
VGQRFDIGVCAFVCCLQVLDKDVMANILKFLDNLKNNNNNNNKCSCSLWACERLIGLLVCFHQVLDKDVMANILKFLDTCHCSSWACERLT